MTRGKNLDLPIPAMVCLHRIAVRPDNIIWEEFLVLPGVKGLDYHATNRHLSHLQATHNQWNRRPQREKSRVQTIIELRIEMESRLAASQMGELRDCSSPPRLPLPAVWPCACTSPPKCVSHDMHDYRGLLGVCKLALTVTA